jgi:hypothetical protein
MCCLITTETFNSLLVGIGGGFLWHGGSWAGLCWLGLQYGTNECSQKIMWYVSNVGIPGGESYHYYFNEKPPLALRKCKQLQQEARSS